MLGKSPVGNCVRKVIRVANGGRYVNPQRRVIPADVVEQPGQILFEMPALCEKQRDDSDLPDILGGQSSNGRFKGWLHHFQKREFHANAGVLAAQPCHDPAKRLRPRRIAGTVGKQQDCRSRCVFHLTERRSPIPTSVADREAAS